MATFDFIQGEKFRLSLESDYEELNAAIQVKAWKAVHILAGSIIEAILVDYLITLGKQKKLSADPLRMSLGDAISECRKEDIISDRTEHLLHVVQSYRNLIHPGRSVRLGETATENSAKIVHALIDIIAEEVASRRKQNYGYTAEQIMTKLQHDSTAIAIIENLLEDTNEYEKERLLLEAVPERYLNLTTVVNPDDIPENLLSSFVTCFRLTFKTASEETKKKVMKNFVRVIKEEKSRIVWRYVFFRAEDLQYLSFEDASLIKKHFLSILEAPLKTEMLDAIKGIGHFLDFSEAISLLYHFINSITLYEGSYIFEPKYNIKGIIQVLVLECYGMSKEVYKALEKKLKEEYEDDMLNSRDKFAETEKTLYQEIFGVSIDFKLDLEETPF